MPMNASGVIRPQSKYDSSDEGSLTMEVKHDDNGCVRITFGKKIAWLAMSPPQAVQLAQVLMKHAEAGMSHHQGRIPLILPRPR